jgi:hypothetical protein
MAAGAAAGLGDGSDQVDEAAAPIVRPHEIVEF